MDTEGSDPELQIVRRLGRFEMSEAIVDDMPLATEIFRQLGFVPWDVSYIGAKGTFSMLGTSPGFREIRGEEPAPYYEILVRTIGPTPDDPPDTPTKLQISLREQTFEEVVAELSEDSKVVGGEQ